MGSALFAENMMCRMPGETIGFGGEGMSTPRPGASTPFAPPSTITWASYGMTGGASCRPPSMPGEPLDIPPSAVDVDPDEPVAATDPALAPALEPALPPPPVPPMPLPLP